MKYLVNEFFGSLYLEKGGMLVKKLVDASYINYLGRQWIDVEYRKKHIKEKVISE
jgi:hypothetical protein